MRLSATLFLALLLFVQTSCSVRSSSLQIENVDQNQWRELTEAVTTVTTSFGFRPDAGEYYERNPSVGDGWVVIAGYSNRGRGRADLAGGHSHVELSIFARPKLRAAKVTVMDYTNSDQTEYLRALEIALEESLGRSRQVVEGGWEVNVVRTLPP